MITTAGYNAAITCLAQRWPDLSSAAGGGPIRGAIFNHFRKLDDATLSASVDMVLEQGDDGYKPWDVVRHLVRAAENIRPYLAASARSFVDMVRTSPHRARGFLEIPPRYPSETVADLRKAWPERFTRHPDKLGWSLYRLWTKEEQLFRQWELGCPPGNIAPQLINATPEEARDIIERYLDRRKETPTDDA